jgi:hypothetical protein
VLTIYQKIIIAALVAAFAGDPLIYYLKKLLVDPRARFAVDLSGILERTALIFAIVMGRYFIVLIPLVVLIRALSLMEEGSLKKYSTIIKREEPAIQFQKVQLKSELAVTLLASSTLGILLGITATLF